MRIEARTMQRQEQRLLPSMLQSIEVLQLATADLLELVAQEVADNEVLDVAPPMESRQGEAGPMEAGAVEARGAEDASAESDRPASAAGDDEVDGRRALIENQPARAELLLDHVREQVAFLGVPEPLAGTVAAIAALLDERGLLPIAPELLAAELGLDAGLAAEALSVLRSLEPRGLAACSGVEAMLQQAQGDPDYPVIERLLTEHLDALARNRLPEVARALRLEVEELAALIERLAAYDPRPGSAFHDRPAPAVTPDVTAWIDGGEVVIALADERVPQLAVDARYASMAGDRDTDRAVRDYLREKVRKARDLIAAIELRQTTLRRVAAAIMARQREFLAGGRRFLRPLGMAEIAAEVGLHQSTVSRAIAGKWIGTAAGTLRLRDFFDGARDGATAASGRGRGAVAQRLADLVAGEDAAAPLSDDDLCAALAAQGIAIARRTVTKFRCELGIPSSYRRRRHGERRR
jgi:RNA polymerase sigma-54 factor